MCDLQITSLIENNRENPLGLTKPLISDYTTWKRTHTDTTLFLRTAPDTKSWHSHVACVTSDSSSVSTASVFGCCMNEVSWGKWYFVSVRCLLIVGSLMWTEVFWTQKPGGGRETTCDNTGNLDYRCAARSGKTATSKTPLPLRMKEGFILIVQQREDKTNKAKITF